MEMTVDRCLIDSGWGQHHELVYRHCRRSPFASMLTPSKGRAVTKTSKPISEWKKQPGQKRGLQWVAMRAPGKEKVRLLIYDTNFWKSYAHSRLSTELGDAGALSLYGTTKTARDEHTMFADHCVAEYRTEDGQWKLPVSKPDNHLLDCLTGCCVAADYEGISVTPASRTTKRKRTKGRGAIALSL